MICRNAASGQATALSPIGYLRPRPGSSLIWRRYGGGVGNRCRWAERFAMSEQQQFSEQAFPAESGTLPHRPWTPMSLVNGRGPQAERCGRDGAKRKSVRKSCRSAGNACSLNCCCSNRRKSFCPSPPIAYATSVSPPDEAVALPGTQILDAG